MGPKANKLHVLKANVVQHVYISLKEKNSIIKHSKVEHGQKRIH